jgi:hypothetical protein
MTYCIQHNDIFSVQYDLNAKTFPQESQEYGLSVAVKSEEAEDHESKKKDEPER